MESIITKSSLKSRIILRLILVCFICCVTAATSSAATDYSPTGGWRTSTPEKQGMHSGMLADMLENVRENAYAIESITIIRNGYMVVDAYFYPFAKDKKHIIHSCTKSITSALVGIAIEKGHIKNVNQPLVEFFPEKTISNLDDYKRAITLENLLTMASGLKCRDSYLYKWKGLTEMKNSGDWSQYMIDLPMAEAPGEKFEYCNGVSYLLSVIIQKTTNMKTLHFARKYLFGPLGITDVKWRTSPQGVDIGWGEMWLKPHDMAKIGWLYLNRGRWDGKQIIPAAWVETSTQGHVNSTLFPRYGYQWWVGPSYYMAVGYKGQFIYVIPEKNMVVVFTAALPGRDFYISKELLDEYIIPAAVFSKPLPANPKEMARLDSLLKKCAEAPSEGFIWISEKEGAAKDGVFVRTASPAFKFEYPKGSRKRATDAPDQIMAMENPAGVVFQASVADIPEGMKIRDVGPKVLAVVLENIGSNVEVISNREIKLKDGSKAYRTDIKWLFQGSFSLTTLVVSAFKDGKWVFLTAHPWQSPNEVASIVESLTFQ